MKHLLLAAAFTLGGLLPPYPPLGKTTAQNILSCWIGFLIPIMAP